MSDDLKSFHIGKAHMFMAKASDVGLHLWPQRVAILVPFPLDRTADVQRTAPVIFAVEFDNHWSGDTVRDDGLMSRVYRGVNRTVDSVL